MQNKPIKPKESSEREQLIERLRAQVADAEERGQFDTCHHQMLKQQLDIKEPDNGKQDL